MPGDVVDRVGLTMPNAATPALGRLALLRDSPPRPSRKSPQGCRLGQVLRGRIFQFCSLGDSRLVKGDIRPVATR